MSDIPGQKGMRQNKCSENHLAASHLAAHLHGQSIEDLLQSALKASLLAGEAILQVYDSEDIGLESKIDSSPLTRADLSAHQKIMDILSATSIPVLSEEGDLFDYEQRRYWDPLWIIDPLDGTKEFVKRNGEFTVNIALIHQSRPILGVVFIPVTGKIYMAASGLGSFYLDRPIDQMSPISKLLEQAQVLPLQDRVNQDTLTVVGSRSHPSPDLESFVQRMRQRFRQVDFISAGSSLKICRVAEGSADVYPRFGPTMEWDTAAGQAIAEHANTSFMVWETGLPLTYNRSDLKNPWFVVIKDKTLIATKE